MVGPGRNSVKPSSPAAGESFIVVALGSNVGPREEHLSFARDALRRGGFVWEFASTMHETDPVGGPAGQGAYLNQVLAASRESVLLSPEALLSLALAIERARGRERIERWGPRTLDIDLVLFGDLILQRPGLTVPHPRFHDRRFVLAPLVELLPNLVHPIEGLTVRQLLSRIENSA